MKNRRRIGCMGLMAILLISSLTGCGDTKIVVTTGLAPNDLFRIGHVSCVMPEALVYLEDRDKGGAVGCAQESGFRSESIR